MKKQKINFLKRDGELEAIEAIEWKNTFGARIFLDKREKDGLWHSTEYACGMAMIARKTRAEVIEKINECLGLPGNLEKFHAQINDAIEKYGYANQ